MLYNLLRNLIAASRYEKEDITDKINVFFTFNQITLEEYTGLIELISKG